MATIDQKLDDSQPRKQDDKIKLLTDSDLREIYIRGLLRNLMSVLARTFGEEANRFFDKHGTSVNGDGKKESTEVIMGGNKDRGDCSFDLLVFLFGRTRLTKVVSRLMRTMKNSKQGDATYHELGIAHCLLCVLQHLEHGKHDRHADAITTSMSMGRVVRPLAKLSAIAVEKFGLAEVRRLTTAKLKQAFPNETDDLIESIEASKNANKKSKRLEKLNLSCERLVVAYLLIALSGVQEQQPFESFLK